LENGKGILHVQNEAVLAALSELKNEVLKRLALPAINLWD
jgi:hypothetical protein